VSLSNESAVVENTSFSLSIAISCELSYTKAKIITLQDGVPHWLHTWKFTLLCAVSWQENCSFLLRLSQKFEKSYPNKSTYL